MASILVSAPKFMVPDELRCPYPFFFKRTKLARFAQRALQFWRFFGWWPKKSLGKVHQECLACGALKQTRGGQSSRAPPDAIFHVV
jgi:hypothetical protein